MFKQNSNNMLPEAEKVFTINEYLKVAIIKEKTEIFVNNRYFYTCTHLVVNIPRNEIENFSKINSIDEVAEYIDEPLESRRQLSEKPLDPTTEFWAHCSNLQAWAENDYDTRLLHSNLSFPLLKELYKAGDIQAKRVFKEEVVSRILAGYQPVTQFLLIENYLKVFTPEELEVVANELEQKDIQQALIVRNYAHYLKETHDYDPKVIRKLLHLLLHIPKGTYKFKEIRIRKIALYKILSALKCIQNKMEDPEDPIISRSKIQLRVLNRKCFEVIYSPISHEFSHLQRIVLYLYSSWDKEANIIAEWRTPEIRNQMGNLFYKIGWLSYELTPDGIYMGDKIEELLTHIIEGMLTVEEVLCKLKNPEIFVRKNRYPKAKTSEEYPIESLWSMGTFLGLK